MYVCARMHLCELGGAAACVCECAPASVCVCAHAYLCLCVSEMQVCPVCEYVCVYDSVGLCERVL